MFHAGRGVLRDELPLGADQAPSHGGAGVPSLAPRGPEGTDPGPHAQPGPGASLHRSRVSSLSASSKAQFTPLEHGDGLSRYE